MRHLGLLAASCAALLVFASGASAGQGNDKVRYRCKAKGSDVEFSARYEGRTKKSVAERKFRVELEADAKAGFADGDQFVIDVDGANVGQLTLSGFDGDEVAGETRFDSRGKGESLPFPPNFPSVGRGSEVSLMRGGAVVIGCTLD
ncbi:hypothetical protein IHQ68_00425 [Chelatococcus sambhunathii]|uniref:Membrane-bound lysozyme-inhibitor of c-type lysozyme n=1 Tax=Chelatococcus sambhunathii TaxID=363953 RepID=A0ABU1DAG4_9HYPH|nr:hypothetical protein [Chelatococcus sambhunathii]MDR4305092.1 hypothetical protein [Chelatococcus sambhunathii]